MPPHQPDAPKAIEVREVRPHEYEAAGAIVVAAYEALPGNATSGGYSVELADVAGRVAGATVLVASLDGKVLGCITFVPDASSPLAEDLRNDESGVRMLGVDPSGQGLGVGLALLNACIRLAVAKGSAGLFLHSTPWMERAQAMYLRSGFERVPERDWLPVPEVPLVAFRLDLAGRPAEDGAVAG